MCGVGATLMLIPAAAQRDNLSDPENYALAATGRLQLSDTTVLRATLQVGTRPATCCAAAIMVESLTGCGGSGLICMAQHDNANAPPP